MKNKLINKHLLSSYLMSLAFIGMAGVTTFVAEKEVETVREHSDKKELVDSCKTTCFICLVVAAVSVIMGVFCGVKYPMVVRKNANIMTMHYLRSLFARYPEMKKYSSILTDSNKLNEIAAVVCNGLTESEQKRILTFAKYAEDKSTPKSSTAKLALLEEAIIDVIQKHAKKDPEYMNKILAAIANAGRADIVKTEQKVR